MTPQRTHPLPVRPTDGAISQLRPIVGRSDLASGFWGDWVHANTTRSIPHGIHWMHEAGYLDNLRVAADRRSAPYRGPHWMDSDLYKLLEAIGWDGVRPGSEANREFLDDAIELLERAQLDDGYLNSYYQTVGRGRRWSDFAFGHEMYLGGHLIQAGIAVARGLGDGRLLAVGRRFADHLVRRFGTAETVRVEGHPEIEMALVELYRETAEQAYLDLARSLIDARGRGTLGPGEFGLGYCQDAVPLRQMSELDGHAVRAVYLAAGATDVAVETGDHELLERLEALWDDLVLTKSHITGAIGSHHFHEALGESWQLPPDRAYAETCASIGKMMWGHRLHLATGRDRYPEEIERILYNGFAASTSSDREHFWYRNPLYQRGLLPSPAEGELLQERVEIGTRASWYVTACCPPNVMRTISSLGAYVVSRDDGDLRVDQLISIDLECADGGALRVDTRIPASPDVTVSGSALPDGMGVVVREPRWSESAYEASGSSTAEGLRCDPSAFPAELRFPSRPSVREADYRIDALAGAVAITLGPVLYAVHGRDLDRMEDIVDVAAAAGTAPKAVANEDGWAGMPDILIEGFLRRPISSDPWEPHRPELRPRMLRLRPYAGWADTGPTTMRAWLPRSPV